MYVASVQHARTPHYARRHYCCVTVVFAPPCALCRDRRTGICRLCSFVRLSSLGGGSLPRYFSFNCRFQVLSSSVLFIQLPVLDAVFLGTFHPIPAKKWCPAPQKVTLQQVSKQVVGNPSGQRTLRVATMMSAGADAVDKQVVNDRCLPSLQSQWRAVPQASDKQFVPSLRQAKIPPIRSLSLRHLTLSPALVG